MASPPREGRFQEVPTYGYADANGSTLRVKSCSTSPVREQYPPQRNASQNSAHSNVSRHSLRLKSPYASGGEEMGVGLASHTVSNAMLRDRSGYQGSYSPLRSSVHRSQNNSPKDNRFRQSNKDIERNFKMKKRFEIRDQSPPRDYHRLQSPLRQKSVGSRGCYDDRNEKSVRFQPEGELPNLQRS